MNEKDYENRRRMLNAQIEEATGTMLRAERHLERLTADRIALEIEHEEGVK